MPVGDSALGQVIWRQFQRNSVSVHDLDPVSPKSSGHRRKDGFAYIELDGEHSSFEFLDHLAHYFNCVFFWQMSPYRDWKGVWYARCPTPIPNPNLPFYHRF